jgi:hypothetical protein
MVSQFIFVDEYSIVTKSHCDTERVSSTFGLHHVMKTSDTNQIVSAVINFFILFVYFIKLLYFGLEE